MHTDFWLERWEQNQIGFHQDDFNNHLQAFWDQLQIVWQKPRFIVVAGARLRRDWGGIKPDCGA